MATNLTLAALLATLIAVHDAGDVWRIFAVMLAYGLSYVVVDSAEARLVVATVPREALGGLGGVRLGAQEATKLLAPLLGAGLFAVAGGAAVALLATGSCAASVVLYLCLRADPLRPWRRRGHRTVACGLR